MQFYTKVQYAHFEEGEFINRIQSDYKSTISQIEVFPWERERVKMHIGTATPSITIEADNGTALKLSLSYNKRFVLYYFTVDRKMYIYPFSRLEQAYDFICIFFKEGKVSVLKYPFRKQYVSKKKAARYIDNKSFWYTVNKITIMPKVKLFLMMITIWVCFVSGITLLQNIKTGDSVLSLIVLFSCLLLPFCLYHTIIIANHYLKLSGIAIYVTKGDETIVYKTPFETRQYLKSDLQAVVLVCAEQRNRGIEYGIYYLQFADGSMIIISSIMLNEQEIVTKFGQLPIRKRYTRLFPLVDKNFML
ncbi:hypothetical protein D3C72_703370 [compost metagenome]